MAWEYSGFTDENGNPSYRNTETGEISNSPPPEESASSTDLTLDNITGAQWDESGTFLILETTEGTKYVAPFVGDENVTDLQQYNLGEEGGNLQVGGSPAPDTELDVNAILSKFGLENPAASASTSWVGSQGFAGMVAVSDTPFTAVSATPAPEGSFWDEATQAFMEGPGLVIGAGLGISSLAGAAGLAGTEALAGVTEGLASYVAPEAVAGWDTGMTLEGALAAGDASISAATPGILEAAGLPSFTTAAAGGLGLGTLATGASLASTAADALSSGGDPLTDAADNLYDPSLESLAPDIDPLSQGVPNPTFDAPDIDPTSTGVPNPSFGPGTEYGPAVPKVGTALDRILNGTADAADWLSALGQAAPGLISAYGNSQTADSLSAIADKYWSLGEPYRAELSALTADPSSYLSSSRVTTPVQMGTDALARSLSMGGNPAGNGAALQQLQNYATQGFAGQLTNRENQLANFGGLSTFNAAAPGAATTAVGADQNVWSNLGSAFGNVTNPQQNYSSQLAKLLGIGL